MILSKNEILTTIKNKEIIIAPFDKNKIDACSVDLQRVNLENTLEKIKISSAYCGKLGGRSRFARIDLMVNFQV